MKFNIDKSTKNSIRDIIDNSDKSLMKYYLPLYNCIIRSFEYNFSQGKDIEKTRILTIFFSQVLNILPGLLTSINNRYIYASNIFVRLLQERMYEGRYIILVDNAYYDFMLIEWMQRAYLYKSNRQYVSWLYGSDKGTEHIFTQQEIDASNKKIEKALLNDGLTYLRNHPEISNDTISSINQYHDLLCHPKIKEMKSSWYKSRKRNINNFDDLKSFVIKNLENDKIMFSEYAFDFPGNREKSSAVIHSSWYRLNHMININYRDDYNDVIEFVIDNNEDESLKILKNCLIYIYGIYRNMINYIPTKKMNIEIDKNITDIYGVNITKNS